MATFGVTAPVAVAATTEPQFTTSSDNAAYLSRLPDVRGVTPVAASSSAAPGQPMFRSLFQVGERSEPVSPAVRQLWAHPAAVASAPDASPTMQIPTRGPQPFDLFSDRSGKFSG
jgi:hypothetical protein